MTSREVIKQLKKLGCVELRQKGSHKFFVSPCGNCFTTVADHTGGIKKGTLNGIRKGYGTMPRRRLADATVKLETVFEPDQGGWHVHVPSLKGCRSWGRSLTEARRNIREAISLQEEAFADADAVARDAVLVEDIRLPAVTRRLLKHAQAAKARAQAETAKARAASLEAARKLTEAVSLRDAGELLGLSQEGVRKILKAPEAQNDSTRP